MSFSADVSITNGDDDVTRLQLVASQWTGCQSDHLSAFPVSQSKAKASGSLYEVRGPRDLRRPVVAALRSQSVPIGFRVRRVWYLLLHSTLSLGVWLVSVFWTIG